MIDLKQLRGLASSYKRYKADSMSISLEQIFELIDALESAQKYAASMRSALEDIASGEIVREHCRGPHCEQELGIATADEMSSRAAGALYFIDAAITAPPATEGEEA